MKRFTLKRLLPALVFALAGCTSSSDSSSGGSSGSCSALASSVNVVNPLAAINQIPVLVGAHYVNEITVSVTICQPGTTICQTIPDVLLDTGSNGLRLFTCAISLTLANETQGGANVAECATFADTSSQWGPVKIADVMLGGEKATNVPIHVIDPSFATVPDTCTNIQANPSVTGYNGILGVGLLTQDCGSQCVSVAANHTYFTCNGSACSSVTMPLGKQLVNPVSLMPIDNNGVILALPNVGAAGASQATGLLTLGIATSSGNNAINGGVVAYPASAQATLTTTFNGHTYSASIIDSGSNALYFPGPVSLPQCALNGGTFYCPPSTVAFTASQTGATGSPTNPSVNFSIASASTLFNSGNLASPTFGIPTTGNFDWGLPFFFNKTVYIGISGTSASTLGTGPFWAY